MNRSRQIAFLCLFFVSGACGLIYEIVWSRLLVFIFGGTTFAITTVLGCFMGGLALGSYLAGRFSHKVSKPARLYGLLEIGVGLFCLLVPFLLDLALPMYEALARVSGGSFFWLTLARVGVCAIILIIPTSFMGATLPLLSKAFVQRASELGRAVARLYGINTIGALAGCTAAGFFLLPAIGLSNSILLAASLNILAGLVAFSLAGKPTLEEPPKESKSRGDQRTTGRVAPTLSASIHPAALLWLYGLSGFAAMAYQVAWTRALILSIGASTYAFSAIVACFIFGIAAGSLLIAPWIGRIRALLGLAGLLEGLIGLSALLVAPLFGELPGVVKRVVGSAGATFEQVLTLEILCVAGLLIVPTLCMGALLPLVCAIYQASRAAREPSVSGSAGDSGSSAAGRTVGAVYASNTVGTILGASVAGFALIPWALVGMQRTIMLASAISVVIGTVFLLCERSWRRLPVYATAALVWILGGVVAVTSQPWSKAVMVSGPYLGRTHELGEVVFYREGIDTTVAVTSTPGRIRALLVNGKPDASTGLTDMRTQLLLGHIPLLLKPDAQDVCVIGLGSGITSGAVLAHPVATVDTVEISSAVVAAAEHFSDASNNALDDPRFTLHRADGRNFLLMGDRKYDVIISEPSNPWISGIANLFTSEFFEIARSRLKPGGLHCQWIHAYSLKADDFAAVLKTMADVFEYSQLWGTSLNDYLIVGSDEPIAIDVESIYLTLRRPLVNLALSFVLINDPMQFAYNYVADGQHLASWTGRQEALTDDLPHLEFSAPRYLLKSEPALITAALGDTEGLPALAGSPDSLLTREFLETIRKGREARRHLAAASSEDTLQQRLECLLNTVRCAPYDARMLIEIDHQLKGLERNATLDIQARIDDLYSQIAKLAPWIVQIREQAAGERQKQLWPLGKRPASISNPEFRSMMAEIQDLAGKGEQADALAKARQALGAFPNSWEVLHRAGVLALDVEGPETAVPYLLKGWIIQPGNPDASYHLARAYCRRGDREQALSFLEMAVACGLRDRARIESSELYEALRADARFQQLLRRISSATEKP